MGDALSVPFIVSWCKQIVLDIHSKAGLLLPLKSGTQMWPHVKEIRTHRNPANNQSSESTFHRQIIRNPLPGVRSPQREIQNPGRSWILPLYGATDE